MPLGSSADWGSPRSLHAPIPELENAIRAWDAAARVQRRLAAGAAGGGALDSARIRTAPVPATLLRDPVLAHHLLISAPIAPMPDTRRRSLPSVEPQQLRWRRRPPLPAQR